MASQAVHDLLWVVTSPSFVTGDDVAPAMALDISEIDEPRLDRFVAERPVHRVGRYFENLLLFWLTEIRAVELVANGMQIREGKRTVGEIDFLYRDETEVLVHCEASVKFFLHHPRQGTSDFPGPNASDNYEKKVTKLFDQQLALSKVHYPQVQARHAFVKGMVFLRDDAHLPTDLPARMPSAPLQGRWRRSSELDGLRERGDVVACVAHKPHWFAPPSESEPQEMQAFCDELAAHFDGPAHPVMCSMRDRQGSEVERSFVVSDRWPG